jgi:branched-chain amino acid transport system substrate-binding protein
MGITVPICITDWSDDFQHIAGNSSEHVYFPVDYFDPERSDPLTRKFVDAYKAKWNETPELYAANYYDAVYNILSELVRRVAKSGGNPLDGSELEKAVWTDPSFDTVYGGKITLNLDGSALKTLAIFKIIDGKAAVEKQVMPE